MLKSKHYLLEGILDHKETYTLDNGVMLHIPKDFENNLRERNPQLGRVCAMPEENTLKLKVNDLVCVNHFCFFGGITAGRGYELQNHVTHEGKKLFPVNLDDIYFKYNDKVPEPLEGIILCKSFESPALSGAILLIPAIYEDRAIVTHGRWARETVLVKSHALYPIELDKITYLRVRESEIVAIINDDGSLTPIEGNLVIEDLPEEQIRESGIFVGDAKLTNTIKCKVILSACEGYNAGDTVVGWRKLGVPYGNYRVVNDKDDHIAGRWK